MSNYCFFDSISSELAERVNLKDSIIEFAEANKRQAYILSKPLSKNETDYDYDQAFAVFISGMSPLFINIGDNDESFEDYVDDFIEDFSYLATKYNYREKIGRKRVWDRLFVRRNADQVKLDELLVDDKSLSRVIDLLISLVVGSINDVSRVDLEPANLLESIKSKIILFDTDQTEFVFKTGKNKKYVIQGLAGSGKTELLLHKLKEVYARNDDAKVAFTCFNKILASTMKSRIPEFFDFMKVEKQIKWDENLFCFHAWGSTHKPASGMYRYICHYYNINFGTMQAGSFDFLCKKALEEIKKNGVSEYAFDYVFIDESQDFSDSFIELCELVTSKKVYVAGDVFQNIFRPFDERVNRADLVLKKCYRTDPKNLMFSHALGMGLFENPVLRWLKADEWDACGYYFNKKDDSEAVLTRDPLRRFEDIPDDFESTKLYKLSDEDDEIIAIVDTVSDIIARHDAQANDIALIFIDRDNYIYDLISKFKFTVKEIFGWDINISFESKMRDPDKLFVSNINNAKGLEFPFVICYSRRLKKVPSYRNALYTMMARSFLETHLIFHNYDESVQIDEIFKGLEHLTSKSELKVRIPSQEEIEGQTDLFTFEDELNLEEQVKKYCQERGATARHTAKVIQVINQMADAIDLSESDDEYLESLIQLTFDKYLSL
ncbi:MAG: ATP-binding domain-containing protein [Pseudidiomarina maritima]|nr:ATP-binding domain-containing protein [Pseudidiomarina maritima]